MPLEFADPADPAIDLHVIAPDDLEAWLGNQGDDVATWAQANGFSAGFGQTLTMAGPDGTPKLALVGAGGEKDRARQRFVSGNLPAVLPAGTYRLVSDLAPAQADEFALGWLLGRYRFDRYAAQSEPRAALIAPDGVDAKRIETIAAGEALTRDLINTPTADMGPPELEAAARDLAEQHGASVEVITGYGLIEQNFPMIHAVGRASATAPRLIDLRWGDAGPKLTLVGKGVCFDTGGLNIKPAASMGLMKKDMGGSATVLGLAHMIMELGMKMQLRVLIPAVENAISGNAFRPQDILTSRKGLTVEINNTDAEGRLVLADALAYADEDKPDLIISMATLTGAARVAVGPDLAPFFAPDDATVAALKAAGRKVADPLWELPFWDPYEAMIEPGIADLDNAPKGGFAGCITAALFLRRFVEQTPYAHFDIYGWQPAAAPARPKGGVGQAARAILEALPDVLKL
ncbi:M17 family metallopeptidase [Nereida sp. MMG025]|uniref:leucyl aminopeptidase family protein n=1 Tax=Nereida sp. MMG025 TaxID=2909981 RepID=UPI001F211078|nr:leucyl aminopeptidase family protein [Nereida sp. MMG025]MCF6444465.1 leucyl aminopeptidase family protein [Nereida sp. MMG025]